MNLKIAEKEHCSISLVIPDKDLPVQTTLFSWLISGYDLEATK